MILNNAPQAEAVLSNVGEIGEFRIRNSAKAFNILSSGLYANKIKAIIRELSCNAIDSHTAAGTTQPFEVHLPTTIEPYFSVRDFGTGLSHDQVTNIYTTYFESTKTASNAFIGALGLGSKSPFSYTDNFTVTAIQNGRRGIYSAFINGEGVPSIALMGEDQVTEPNGVEVKFSVNDRFDFNKFADEAQNVYLWFKQRPNFVGRELKIDEIEYETKDIIPGVHSIANVTRCLAVMGNIAYRIEVPQSEQVLEGLHHLLGCGLVMEFGIGELDFQASREGLSYIPQTIDAIRNKLKEVNGALTKVLATEADAIDCMWSKSVLLHKKHRNSLWKSAVVGYVANTNFPLFDSKNSHWAVEYHMKAKESDLQRMNIQLKGFEVVRHSRGMPNVKPHVDYLGAKGADGKEIRESYFHIMVSPSVSFIVNDTTTGAFERAKFHYRNTQRPSHREHIFVLSKLVKDKPMDLKAFYGLLYNPPEAQIKNVSTLSKKPSTGRSGMGKNVNIMVIERRGGSGRHYNNNDLVWRNAGSLDSFDDNKTYYYIPMVGFEPQFKTLYKGYDVHSLCHALSSTKVAELSHSVYGVRKGDIEAIRSKKNWLNLEDHIIKTLTGMNVKIGMCSVWNSLDNHTIFNYNSTKIVDAVQPNSPAKTFLDSFDGVPKLEGLYSLVRLMRELKVPESIDVPAVLAKKKVELVKFNERYPLLDKLSHCANEDDVSQYINLIDSLKGI